MNNILVEESILKAKICSGWKQIGLSSPGFLLNLLDQPEIDAPSLFSKQLLIGKYARVEKKRRKLSAIDRAINSTDAAKKKNKKKKKDKRNHRDQQVGMSVSIESST